MGVTRTCDNCNEANDTVRAVAVSIVVTDLVEPGTTTGTEIGADLCAACRAGDATGRMHAAALRRNEVGAPYHQQARTMRTQAADARREIDRINRVVALRGGTVSDADQRQIATLDATQAQLEQDANAAVQAGTAKSDAIDWRDDAKGGTSGTSGTSGTRKRSARSARAGR